MHSLSCQSFQTSAFPCLVVVRPVLTHPLLQKGLPTRSDRFLRDNRLEPKVNKSQDFLIKR